MAMEIKNILSSNSNVSRRFIRSYKELAVVVRALKASGYRIVLTQGVYDLIHEGHAAYLESARAQGDILIVGVDSDKLTKKRKGPDRPIVPQEERLKMLSHLRSVDILTLREDGDEIGLLIKTIKPDVLVVSKSTTDFTAKMAKEYEPYCKEIITLPPQAVTSTSARIRNLAIEGAEKLAMDITRLIEKHLESVRSKK